MAEPKRFRVSGPGEGPNTALKRVHQYAIIMYFFGVILVIATYFGPLEQDPYQRLKVCTLNVCMPRFWAPNTLIKGHIPRFRGPKPKGTKDNSPRTRS